jgi:endoglucanase
MRRRDLLAVGAGAVLAAPASAASTTQWRGFNLMELIDVGSGGAYRRSDFRNTRDWGFTFLRLPVDYRWIVNSFSPEFEWNQRGIKALDEAMEWGSAYGLHLNLAFHRAPGYCVKPPADRYNLWRDEEAQRDFYTVWGQLTRRYAHVDKERLSFNLVNEPDRTVDRATYTRISAAAVGRIRSVSRDRTVTVDGMLWGRDPAWPEGGPQVIQSARGYLPEQLTKWRFEQWNRASMTWPVPTWPMDVPGSGLWDEARLAGNFERAWGSLAQKGAVHVGEFGCYQNTPHPVALSFIGSNLKVWQAHSCGWALWQLRGPFGVMDSGRADVTYAKTPDGLLDAKMLDLLRS